MKSMVAWGVVGETGHDDSTSDQGSLAQMPGISAGAWPRRLGSMRAALASMPMRDRVAWSLLVVAAAVGWPAIHLPSFVDEFDTLSTGWLMATGSVLYRDVFSHHFPLPYAWVAIIVRVVGRSFGAVRASIWLYTFGTMAVVMLLTRRRLATGVFALSWALIRVMYNGHMAMYTTWSALAVWVVFVLAFEAQADGARRDAATGVVFGLASAVAVLSDPLSIYAVAVGSIALAVRSRRQFAIAVAAGGAIAAMLFGPLALRGGLGPFWSDVMRFNARYSAHFLGKSPYRLPEMQWIAQTGLRVADPLWRNFDPLKALSWDYGMFDRWAFTGLAYRVALLVACASWLFARRPAWAIGMYAFVVALHANDRLGIRAAAVAIIAVWIMAAYATGEWPAPLGGRIGRVGVGVAAAVLLAFLTARVATFAYAPAHWTARQAQYLTEIFERDRLRTLACDQPNVELAGWPGQLSTYWYTTWRPVAGYLYFWPWVAEAGLPKVLEHLADPDVRAVVMLRDTVVWGRWDTRDYLAPLHRMLEERYVPAGPDTWVSPALAASCAGR